MLTVIVRFLDKIYFKMENVEKIVYRPLDGETITVEGEELMTHKFPLMKEFFLCSAKRCFRTTGRDIIDIQISRES